MEIKPIGTARSAFKQRFGIPRQPSFAKGCMGRIELDKSLDYTSLLDGIEGFSHIWLLWYFHEHEATRGRNKVCVPKLAGEKKGCLATRSPIRPNPIAMSAVRLLKVEGNCLWVDEVDFIDNSPVLDIKPYVADYDSIEGATKADWLVKPELIKVSFSEEALQSIPLREAKIKQDYPDFTDLKSTLTNILQEDPRNELMKKVGGDKIYGFTFYNFDIHFKYLGSGFEVVRILD